MLGNKNLVNCHFRQLVRHSLKSVAASYEILLTVCYLICSGILK